MENLLVLKGLAGLMQNASNIINIQTLMLFVAEKLMGWFLDLLHFGSQPPVVGAVAYLSVEDSLPLFDPSMA